MVVFSDDLVYGVRWVACLFVGVKGGITRVEVVQRNEPISVNCKQCKSARIEASVCEKDDNNSQQEDEKQR